MSRNSIVAPCSACYGPTDGTASLAETGRAARRRDDCLPRVGRLRTYYDLGGLWFWLASGATVYAIWDFFLSGSYRDATE